MRLGKNIIYILLLISSLWSISLEVKPSHDTIGLQDTLILKVTLKGEKMSFNQTPTITSTGMILSATLKSSSFIQIINGKPNFSNEYEYSLKPNTTGNIPITITIENQSKDISIKVVKGSIIKNNNTSKSPPPSVNSLDDLFDSFNYSKEEIIKPILKTELSNDNPYEFEPVIINFYIYKPLKANLEDFVFREGLSVKEGTSFPIEELNEDHETKDVVIDNKIYEKIPLKYIKHMIPFNTKFQYNSGSLTLSYSTRNMWGNKILSLPFEQSSIKIKKLPKESKNFSKVYASKVELKSHIEQNQLEVSTPIILKLSIHANGNLRYLEPPTLNIPNTYIRLIKKPIKEILSDNKIKAIQILEYYITPKTKGTLTIKPISINYFNFKTDLYKTVQTKPITLNIKPSSKKDQLSTDNDNITSINYIDTLDRNIPIFIFNTILILLSIGIALYSIVSYTLRKTKERHNVSQKKIINVISNKINEQEELLQILNFYLLTLASNQSIKNELSNINILNYLKNIYPNENENFIELIELNNTLEKNKFNPDKNDVDPKVFYKKQSEKLLRVISNLNQNKKLYV